MSSKFEFEADKIYQFSNCRIVKNHKLVKEDLWVRNGKIINPVNVFFEEKVNSNFVVDCGNFILSPGFIDIQINGAFGKDFSLEPEKICENVAEVAKGILSHGVTSFCPTVITSHLDVYEKVLKIVQKKEGGHNGAEVLGLHLEGPFISKEMKGAHEIECITSFEDGAQILNTFCNHLDKISLVTLAPELPGAMDAIDKLTKGGVIVSIGHSSANFQIGQEAVARGASLITHLFNAMLPFHHRNPNLMGLLAFAHRPDFPGIHFGIIADGVHSHIASLNFAYKTHPKGLILVTDAISAMGLEEGLHYLGNQAIEIKDGRAVIAGTNTLCGSISSLDQCIRFFQNNTECDIVEALEAATLHPAEVLKITDRKGTLDFNTDADFVLLDDSLHVQATFIAGDLVWKKEQFVFEFIPQETTALTKGN